MVASANPVKLRAARAAFAAQFPGEPLELESVCVPSGVSDQPLADEETRSGAHNRVAAARAARPHADFWVGLEGGLERIGEGCFASAWMVVSDAAGRLGEARTPTLPLPPAVQALLGEGMELGEANDRVFATVDSKEGGGAFGLLTDGRLTRAGVYAQALQLALIPLVHGLWRGAD